MIYQQFAIDYNNVQVKNLKVTYPFYIVMHTENKELEIDCKQQWPKLMYTATSLSESDKIQLNKMRLYIQRKLKMQHQDLNNIHKMFYERNIMGPLILSQGCSSVDLVHFDCKLWTDPEVPFLELHGEITIDCEKMLDIYIKRSYLQMKTDNKFVRESITIRFVKALPMIMTTVDREVVRKTLLLWFEINCKKSTSVLNKKLETLLKIKQLHTFKKEINWTQPNEITIEINDFAKLLGLKTKKNLLPLTVGGFIAYDLLLKNRLKQIMK